MRRIARLDGHRGRGQRAGRVVEPGNGDAHLFRILRGDVDGDVLGHAGAAQGGQKGGEKERRGNARDESHANVLGIASPPAGGKHAYRRLAMSIIAAPPPWPKVPGSPAMKKMMLSAAVATLFLPFIVSAQAPTAAEKVAGVPVIPRSALFGNPEKTQARVSPDGKYVSFIAPKDGVLNVWVGPPSDPSAAKAVTSDTKRGIRQHFWAYDNKHVLYIQDEGGDENWHLYATDVVAGTTKDLTPYKGIQAQVGGLSWKKPGVVAVGLNDRAAEWHDLWEVNLATGKRVLVEQNAQEFAGYELDLDLKPKLALKSLSDGGGEIFRKAAGKWVSLLKYGQADSLTTATIGVEGTGTTALMQSSVGRDKSALVRVDLATGKTTVLGASEQADVESIWTDPRTRVPQAYTVNYLKPEIVVLSPGVQ